MTDPLMHRETVERLAEEFVDRHRRGEQPTPEEYATAHPEHAAEIRDLFPALLVMEELAPSDDGTGSVPLTQAATPSVPRERLGDYRILREVGRGGMGIVYEAEQESLGRHVALKVLAKPAAREPNSLARFRREARVAARLHHTNIVPVFEVGQDGDDCFYAMQFIQGQALDEVFKELQRQRAASAQGRAATTCRATDATEPAAPADHSDFSTLSSDRGRYVRGVARTGLQAAEALAHAHAHGILHRDVKPSNLLLDTTGVVWVTDFGLAAHAEAQARGEDVLTQTGDLVGTLRYMAPERFNGVCDARADVYGLGLTLYELLVLRPAFDSPDRLRLLEQIAHQDPVRPRLLDPRIPRDLETIVLKAIEKDPRRRYPSAEDFAEDLRRFLADEPIRARRTGVVERLWRWGRRNPLVAALSAAVLLVTLTGFGGVFGQWQEAEAKEHEADDARTRAEKQRDESHELAEQLRTTQQQLRRMLYIADMNWAYNAWHRGHLDRVEELVEESRPKPGEPDYRAFEWFFLHRLCHAELMKLEGHSDIVQSVAYSPDGQRLASASTGEVIVWDADSGKELLRFTYPPGANRMTAFSPDGKHLAVLSFVFGEKLGLATSGDVRIVDLATGKEVHRIPVDSEPGQNLAFSPDGTRLASGKRVWDTATGEELFTLKGHAQPIVTSAFSRNGKRLATGSGSYGTGGAVEWLGDVKVWDAAGKELLTIKDTGLVKALAFHPDNRHVAVAASKNGGGSALIYDVDTGKEVLSIPCWTSHLAFDPSGLRLATASNYVVNLWDTRNGKLLGSFSPGGAHVNAVAFSPDGRRLASAQRYKTVKIWDTAASMPHGAPLDARLAVYHGGLAFSPDGTRLAWSWGGQNEGWVKLGDPATGRVQLTLRAHDGVNDPVFGVAFSPDGRWLAAGTMATPAANKQTGEVILWDAQSGKELRTLRGHDRGVNGVAFSPDGKRLASASWDRTVKVWDLASGRDLLTLSGHNEEVQAVAFSPDGKRLASGSIKEVKLWDAATGKELRTLAAGALNVHGLAFSPDGKYLATSFSVFDVETGKEQFALKGADLYSGNVAFSPDGKRLATDGSVVLFDVATGKETLMLKPHDDVAAECVAFSPDGRRLAALNMDGTVQVWDSTPLREKP